MLIKMHLLNIKQDLQLSADNKLGIIYKGETIWLTHIRNTSQFLTPKTIACKVWQRWNAICKRCSWY